MSEMNLKTFRDVKVGDTLYDFSSSDKWMANVVTGIIGGKYSVTFCCVDSNGVDRMLFIPNNRINDFVAGSTTTVDDEEFAKKHELFLKARRMVTDNTYYRWVRRNRLSTPLRL